MKARKLPSGNWRVQPFIEGENGKRKRISFTAPTKAEAMRRAMEYIENCAGHVDAYEFYISDCIEKYISSKENVLSPSTLREYLRCYKSGVYDSILDVKLRNITSQRLQVFISDISKGRAQKTVKNIYGLLISSIKMFSDKSFRVTLPANKPYTYNIPISDDVNTLISKSEPDLRLCIILASVGALRRGEICGLQYKDVSVKKNTLHIHSDIVLDKNGEWVRKEIPKTSTSTRIIEVPQEVINMIGTGEPEEYIYKRTPDTISWRFRDLRDSLGMKCRFHDLRHYAASIMHAIGVPDQYIMEKGGWKSDTVLKSVYRNSLSDMSAKFQKQTNEFYSETLILTQNAHENAHTDLKSTQ